MSSLAIGGIVLACVFGGALLGMLLGAILPKHHLSADSKDVIKVAMAMIATLAALVVGLLIASAKGSFETKDSELKRQAAHAILLDRTMAEYGPEAREARDVLRQIVTMRLRQISKGGSAEDARSAIGLGSGIEAVQRKLLGLSPQNDAQRWLKSTALQMSGEIAEARWLLLEQTGSSIQWPFMTILVFWLALIFTSFGLFAPRNGIALTALFAGALSVAGAIYLIVEMDEPHSGLMKISDSPLRTALDQLGRQ